MNIFQKNRDTFFKTLKKSREESPHTQQQMADKLGITIKQYQKYQSKTLPPHEKLFKINELLKTDLSRCIYQQNIPYKMSEAEEKRKPDKDNEVEYLKLRVNDLENHIKDLQEDNSVFRKLLEKEDTPQMKSANSAG